MKIGLASYEFINNDIEFNMSQIEKAMQSMQGKVDLLCFGETFLQGFDSLNWNYDNDKDVAIAQGEIIYNYRRISKNWKEYDITDYHYKEGNETEGFRYKDHLIKIALCGDMWVYPEKFRTDDLLIWPVYVNFDLEDWPQYELEYAEQAKLACDRTLMINSISKNPDSHGNVFYFTKGNIEEKLEYDAEDILVVEV